MPRLVLLLTVIFLASVGITLRPVLALEMWPAAQAGAIEHPHDVGSHRQTGGDDAHADGDRTCHHNADATASCSSATGCPALVEAERGSPLLAMIGIRVGIGSPRAPAGVITLPTNPPPNALVTV